MKNNCLNFCDHLNEYANYSESDSIHNRKSSQALFQKVSKGYTKSSQTSHSASPHLLGILYGPTPWRKEPSTDPT